MAISWGDVEVGAQEALFLVNYTRRVVTGELADEDRVLRASGFEDAKKDVVALACFVFGMFITVRTLQATVFSLLAKLAGLKTDKETAKFAEALREFSFYSLSLFLSWVCLGRESWLYNLDEMWKYDRQYTVPAEFKALYFLEASWYLAGVISLFLDAKRKDFVEMTTHHLCTVVLLLLSFQQSHCRVGAVVWILHNLSDPFLQGAKLFNYLKLEPWSTISFVIFMLVFMVTRLLYYPCVIYSCHFRGPGYFFNRNHSAPEHTLVGALTLLIPIHIYWFFLIIKVAQRAIAGKIQDERSDSDDDDEHSSSKKKQ